MTDNKALLGKAVAYFDDAVRESDEIISKHNCSHALQDELAEQKEYFVTALASMRENAELRAQLAAVTVKRDAMTGSGASQARACYDVVRLRQQRR